VGTFVHRELGWIAESLLSLADDEQAAATSRAKDEFFLPLSARMPSLMPVRATIGNHSSP